MVRALLAGAKTQTRRIVKPQPVGAFMPLISFNHGREEIAFGPENRDRSGTGPKWWRCPYGRFGDTLWVREGAWYDRSEIAGLGKRCFFEGGLVHFANGSTGHGPGHPDTYTAEMFGLNSSLKKRPSIHMPRWASRISLRITDVRVERLNEISEADALAEGIERIHFPEVGEWGWPQRKYAELWERINGPGSWAANPWVWCVAFEIIK